jgi:hypothetical protein
MKHVYNTGKVQIGLRYEKPKNYTISRDMENLQRGLLEERLGKRANAAAIVVLYVFALVSVAMYWVIK